MSDLWVFDVYTAKVAAVIVGFACCMFGCVFLAKRFPRQAELATRMLLPMVFLLMLGFCSLQMAQLERQTAKSNLSKGDPS